MRYIPPYGSADPNAPYVDRNAQTAQRGSAVPAEFFNATQAELLGLIQAGGLTPTQNGQQLATAIQRGQMNFAGASAQGGNQNAWIATLAPVPVDFPAGFTVTLFLFVSNNGPVTLNLNGKGAKSVRRSDGSELQAGDALAGEILTLVYDGTVWRAGRPLGNQYLPLAGGTLTGPLTLPGAPSQDLHAATRAYVDHPGFVGVASAVTLTQAHLRKYIEVTGGGSYTITLPAPEAATTTGGMYWFYNAGASEKTLATPSGNFVGPRGSNGPTLTLPRNAFVWVIAGYDNWVVVYQSYSFTLLGAARTLPPSALGGYVQLGGATTYTVTLPNPSDFSGAELEIYNSGSIAYTLATPSGQFVGPKGSGAATVSIPAGEYFMLRAGTVHWIAH
ncbi:hypothetical protein BJF92_12240 [Rhizobium rhizosphaerae]|uniref:Tail fiber protein n=1 Tax=Xaviernesmea rhizosphaerae TaxID=1672749 RepID=A0A1Q9AN68_9HYPH|nr:hypothetical protein [Xaviernesmea rhizosphaerae]OLP56834.1 hypothetical protein BJF92_12240 [Xaviernesmea rhizosphaerae]